LPRDAYDNQDSDTYSYCDTDANRNAYTNSDGDTDRNARIERINLQWGNSIC